MADTTATAATATADTISTTNATQNPVAAAAQVAAAAVAAAAQTDDADTTILEPTTTTVTTTIARQPQQQPDTINSATSIVYDVIIVGAGLSGAFLARRWHDEGRRLLLLEATDRPGGRLRNATTTNSTATSTTNTTTTTVIDMGAAWCWPEFQTHMQQTVQWLDIPTFLQPDDLQTTRIVGGTVAIVHKLLEPLVAAAALGNESSRIHYNTPVNALEYNDGTGTITLRTTTHQTYTARRVVLAAPPRVLLHHMTFTPPLAAPKHAAMAASHTWMAGCSKVALVYATKFWTAEHSSLMVSQGGPAFQVYDGSDHRSSDDPHKQYVLTCFCTIKDTMGNDAEIAKRVAGQLDSTWKAYGCATYSAHVYNYTEYHVQRWPMCPYVSESPQCIHSHPTPIPNLATSEWDHRLLFAGSETDSKHPGLMEGALGVALRIWGVMKW